MPDMLDRLIRWVLAAEAMLHERYRRTVRRTRAARRRVRLHVGVLWWGRASIVLAVVAIAVACVPPQAREAIVVASEDLGTAGGPWRVMMLSAVLCSIGLWYSYRVILSRRLPGAKHSRRRRLAWMVRHLPRITGMAPFAAVCIGALIPPGGWSTCRTTILAAPALALAVYLVYVVREPLFNRTVAVMREYGARLVPQLARRLAPIIEVDQHSRLWTWAGIIVVLLLAAIIAVVYTADPVSASGHGPVGIVLLGVLAWVCASSVVVNLSDESRWPFTAAAMMLPIAWGLLDVNDNHAVRALPTARPAPAALRDDFACWLSARPDRAAYESRRRPYPVVLVAAEGGGMYAAYHAAMVLARLQDADARFADHLYAVSGVSGGSVGSAVFAGLIAAGVPAAACTDRAKGVLSRDLLSPLLASAVFPDTLQQFLPVPVGPFDRARALEESIEHAWDREAQAASMPTKWMNQSFFSAAATYPGRSAPLLFLNTTCVETGGRVVLSPVRWTPSAPGGGMFLDDINPALNVRVSTAAGLSARFPILSPAGFVRRASSGAAALPEKVRLVDGGYYENSGSATLADLIDALPPTSEALNYRLVVVQIRSANGASSRPAGRWLGELLSPVRAMYRGRIARSGDSLSRLRQTVEGRGGMFVEFVLWLDRSGPPLGWLLSEDSRRRIERSVTSTNPMPGVARTNAEAFEAVLCELR